MRALTICPSLEQSAPRADMVVELCLLSSSSGSLFFCFVNHKPFSKCHFQLQDFWMLLIGRAMAHDHRRVPFVANYFSTALHRYKCDQTVKLKHAGLLVSLNFKAAAYMNIVSGCSAKLYSTAIKLTNEKTNETQSTHITSCVSPQ